VRAILSWAVAAPFGYVGDTARPMPTPNVVEMIDALDGPIAVGPCRCRATHRACDHPMETDIVIRTGVEAWTRAFPHEYRLIEKAEAIRIVTDAQRLGMWQMVFIHCPVNRENEYVICNCCRCGCVPYILNRDLGQRVYPLLRGDYTAYTDPACCAGHGACVAACPFGARALVDGHRHRRSGTPQGSGLPSAPCGVPLPLPWPTSLRSQGRQAQGTPQAQLVDPCFGCGVCVAVCPEGAITMRQEPNTRRQT